ITTLVGLILAFSLHPLTKSGFHERASFKWMRGAINDAGCAVRGDLTQPVNIDRYRRGRWPSDTQEGAAHAGDRAEDFRQLSNPDRTSQRCRSTSPRLVEAAETLPRDYRDSVLIGFSGAGLPRSTLTPLRFR